MATSPDVFQLATFDDTDIAHIFKSEIPTVRHEMISISDAYPPVYPYLVGGIPTPLKNMSSSVGVTIPNIYGEIKNVSSKPPTRTERKQIWNRQPDFLDVVLPRICFWLVFFCLPSEKWWSSSVGMMNFHSQLNGKSFKIPWWMMVNDGEWWLIVVNIQSIYQTIHGSKPTSSVLFLNLSSPDSGIQRIPRELPSEPWRK